MWFVFFYWNRLRPPSKSLSSSSFLQSSSFDVPLRPSHRSVTCYLRSIPCTRVEESFSMEPRIMFMGRNDKECCLGSIYPWTSSLYMLNVIWLHSLSDTELYDSCVNTSYNIQSSITLSRHFAFVSGSSCNSAWTFFLFFDTRLIEIEI